MKIEVANIEDSEKILSLQKLAYQSEADIYQDHRIPPLMQTIEDLKGEFRVQTFLKVTDEKDDIIGSVRAYADKGSCYIGRLIVHPEWQGKGIGTKLMDTIEKHFTNVQRNELFTGIKSVGNIRFYKRLGYRPFKEQAINKSLSLIYLEKHTDLASKQNRQSNSNHTVR